MQEVPVFRIEVQGTKDVIRLQAELKKAKAEARKTTDQTEFTRLAEQIVKLESQLKSARAEQRKAINEFTAADKGAGAYKRLSAQLNASKAALKNLAAEGKAGTAEFKNMLASTQALDARLKMIDASVGEFGRNVGNYAGSLKGLFGQLRQTIGRSSVFRALPMLFGAAQQALDKLQQGVELYNETFSESYVLNKQVEAATAGLISEFIDERKTLDGLAKVATDENETKERRAMAVDALQAQYPDYFKSLDRENISVEAVAEGYKNVNREIENALKAKIRAQIIEAQLADAVQKTLDAEKQQAKQQALNAVTALDAQGLILRGIGEVQSEQATIAAKTATAASQNIEQVDAALEKVFATLKLTVKDASNAFDDSDRNLKELGEKTAKQAEKTTATLEKEAEKRKATIEKLNADILELERKNAESVADLKAQLSQSIIDNIADEGERAKAQELLNFENRKKARQTEFNNIIAQTEEQEQKLIEIYGEGSAEVINFRKEAFNEIAALEKLFAQLSEQDAIAFQAALTKIQKQGIDDRSKQEEEAFQKRLEQAQIESNELETAYQYQLLIIQELVAKGQKTTIQGAKDELSLRKKLLQEQAALIQSNLDKGLYADEQARQQLILQRQQLNTELAQLEEEQTKKVEQESQKQKEKRLQAVQEVFSAGSQILGAFSDLFNAQDEAETKRYDMQIETRQKQIDSINAQLQNATGLQAAFLQQQLDAQIQQQEELEKKKTEIQKKAAKRNKAIAIAQAVISTAQSVATALSNPPGVPYTIPFGILAGALGAVQIATIAAQPLATGGIVGQHINGKPITRANGDNVLTTLKTGEVVLNEAQQNRLGAGALSFAGVPGFAGGGIVPASTKPTVTSGGNFSDMITALDAKTDAINARIDRIEVIHTNRTQASIDEDKQQRIQIKTANRL